MLSQQVRQFITDFYIGARNAQQTLEVRFLLSNINNASKPSPVPPGQVLHCGYDIILTDIAHELHSSLLSYVGSTFPLDKQIGVSQITEFRSLSPGEVDCSNALQLRTYKSVCLGGTFDRMHVGHRILLSEACLLANESLLVGVTDGKMNDSKMLSELMQTTDERIKAVQNFVTDVKPVLHYNIVPITDPFGPSVTDPSFRCIVVSRETVRGADAINRRRSAQGMDELAVEIIEVIADPEHAVHEEEKVSSSSTRKRLLGTLLRPPLKALSRPYIIGLTGSTASGKSSICNRLERLGAAVIDCDKLGHMSYKPGTAVYYQLISEFGNDILADDSHIDRRRLSARVFKNKDDLARLNVIVWPAVRQLCLHEIESAAAIGKPVVVLDAAVLLEAGWDTMVHEVWTAVIPVDEAVRRLVERNGLTKEESLCRVRSQMSNEQRVSRANVVLCTLWHPDITQKQVEKAWNHLQVRITPNAS
jgi:phosphopantetheine adenylyltransferase/dephospho-CoA kinase